MEVNAYPSQDGLSVYFRDITDRKKVEEEMARLAKLNLIGQMAAGIAHEVRNPMTTVRGLLQLLAGKKDSQKYKQDYNLMIEELDRANKIITEFFSLAKNKSENLKLQNPNTIIETMFPLINADALNSNLNVKIELEQLPDLLINEKEIRQLLLNLVRNGLEAMDSGGCITISTFTEGKKVVLAVHDQGKGIPPEVLEKLGTPFLTTKPDGTGLGLATCFNIAKRHNAVIDIDTEATGTKIHVSFERTK